MNRDFVDLNVFLINCSGDGVVLLVLSIFVDIFIEFFFDRVVGFFLIDFVNKY